jgi:hypothetical protein
MLNFPPVGNNSRSSWGLDFLCRRMAARTNEHENGYQQAPESLVDLPTTVLIHVFLLQT